MSVSELMTYEQLRKRLLCLYWRAMTHSDFVTLDLMLNELILLDAEYVSNLEVQHGTSNSLSYP